MSPNKCVLCNSENIPDSERDFATEKLLALVLPSLAAYLSDPSYSLILEAKTDAQRMIRLNIWDRK